MYCGGLERYDLESMCDLQQALLDGRHNLEAARSILHP